VTAETATSTIEAEIERNFRHNALMNVLDGSFFWFSLSFVATSTIVPLWLSRLTDSRPLIGLGSALHIAGWYLPQLFTANWVQRLTRKKVAPVHVGFFSERLPLVLLAPAALLAIRSKTQALIVFFVLYAWSSIGAGFVAVGWQDLYAKVVPRDRRARLFGLINFIGMGGGILTAAAASWLLERFEFPYGYALCFLAAGFLTLVSWLGLALVREPPSVITGPRTTLRQFWRGLPAVLRAHPNFRRFLASQAIVRLGSMATGFLAVYSVQRWRLSDEQAAAYTVAMVAGQALGNLPFGYIGDRWGQKLVYEISQVAWLTALVLALVAPGPWWFYAVFALAGISFSGSYQSGVMIGMEFSSPEERPTFIGLNSTVAGIAAGVAPLLGGWLAGAFGYQALFAATLLISGGGLASLHWLVTEPRRETDSALTPAE
jgi:MFS family permease